MAELTDLETGVLRALTPHDLEDNVPAKEIAARAGIDYHQFLKATGSLVKKGYLRLGCAKTAVIVTAKGQFELNRIIHYGPARQ